MCCTATAVVYTTNSIDDEEEDHVPSQNGNKIVIKDSVTASSVVRGSAIFLGDRDSMGMVTQREVPSWCAILCDLMAPQSYLLPYLTQ